jgi:hypothetical protein
MNISDQLWVIERIADGILPDGAREAILASLRDYKRIQEAKVPKEPHWLRLRNGFIGNADGSETPTYGQYATRADYDTLLDLLRRETAKNERIKELLREPTKEMLIDGAKAVRDFNSEKGEYPRTRAMWKAMSAALLAEVEKDK